jgi:hypothetical protein
MTDEQAERVARGLTEGERNLLFVSRVDQPMAYVAFNGRVHVSCFQKDLIERATDQEDEIDDILFRLTTLGLRVRAILTKEQQG